MVILFQTVAVVLLFAVLGCVDVEKSSESAVVKTDELTSVVEVDSKGAQATAARLIVLVPPADAPADGDTQVMLPIALSEFPAGTPEPIRQTVLPNGTVLLNFGNRFARPLVATIDCNGVVTKTHMDMGESPDATANSCGTADRDDQ